MAIPEGVPRVTVTTGLPLTAPGGTPVQGRLLFIGPDLVVVPGLDLTLEGAEPMPLVDGLGSVDLVPSDVATMNPGGWTYEVRSAFTNAPNWVRYIRLTSDMDTVKLADVLVPDPVTGAYTVLIDPSTLGGAAFLDVGTTAGTVAAGTTLADAKAYTDGHAGGGGSVGVSSDGRINEEIVVLAAAADWTIVTTSLGVEIGVTVAASVGDRIWFSPSFLRTGGVVFLDMGIKAAAGGVSRYISSGTATPRTEGYAALYPLVTFTGVAGIREFIVQAGEVDGDGNVKIVLAYKGPADGNQSLYFGGGYDGAIWTNNPDA